VRSRVGCLGSCLFAAPASGTVEESVPVAGVAGPNGNGEVPLARGFVEGVCGGFADRWPGLLRKACRWGTLVRAGVFPRLGTVDDGVVAKP